jgi:S-methylmethionine-dependent homocysteine/selenocysteine methylase
MILLDGPIGTELAARGVATPAPGWSANAIASAPEVLAAIHRDYADAGARVHTAATFRTQPSLGTGWEELARRAVAIARASVPRDHRIAGSVAPVNDCYRPDLAPADDGLLREAHGAVARVLAGAGVDLLLCETFPLAREAYVAVEACVATACETWLALTAGPDGRLMTPDAMERAAHGAVERGARAVLVNCTPARETLGFVERLARAGVSFGAYANAGSVEDGLGWGADAASGAARYAELARTWRGAGATILGGCCGTSPAHIRALAGLQVRA